MSAVDGPSERLLHRGGLVCVYCSEMAHRRFWEVENWMWGAQANVVVVVVVVVAVVVVCVVVVCVVVVCVVVVVAVVVVVVIVVVVSHLMTIC